MGKILSIAICFLTMILPSQASSRSGLPPELSRMSIDAVDTSDLSRREVMDLVCMSLNIYHEARGTSHNNQLAVALVTRNRQNVIGGSICHVVYQPRQFSWTARRPGRPAERQAWETAQRIAYMVMHTEGVHDITYGATHFHERTIRPDWSRRAITRRVIGAHVFMTIRGYGSPMELAQARD